MREFSSGTQSIHLSFITQNYYQTIVNGNKICGLKFESYNYILFCYDTYFESSTKEVLGRSNYYPRSNYLSNFIKAGVDEYYMIDTRSSQYKLIFIRI